jgi:hypothetical protein
MNHTFIPADATLVELRKKAADCEQRATQEQEPLATALREEGRFIGSGLRPHGQGAGRHDCRADAPRFLMSAYTISPLIGQHC